jgi:hypothetical protein
MAMEKERKKEVRRLDSISTPLRTVHLALRNWKLEERKESRDRERGRRQARS